MNLATPVPEPNQTSVVIFSPSRTFSPSGPRISRYEFEQLLQRAMEIQNARDLAAQIVASFRPQA